MFFLWGRSLFLSYLELCLLNDRKTGVGKVPSVCKLVYNIRQYNGNLYEKQRRICMGQIEEREEIAKQVIRAFGYNETQPVFQELKEYLIDPEKKKPSVYNQSKFTAKWYPLQSYLPADEEKEGSIRSSMIAQVIHLWAETVPEQLIKFFSLSAERHFYYRLAELSHEFLHKDLRNTIYIVLKESCDNGIAFLDRFISSLLKEEPRFWDELVETYDTLNKEEQAIVILVMADQQNDAWMKENFFPYFIPWFRANRNKVEAYQFLLHVLSRCSEKSKASKECAQKLLPSCSYKRLRTLFYDWGKQLFKQSIRFQVRKTELHCGLFLICTFGVQSMKESYEQIKKLAWEEPKEYLEVISEFLKENNFYALPAYAILKKENPAAIEKEDWNQRLEQFVQNMTKNAINGTYGVFGAKEEFDFGQLSEPFYSNVKLKWNLSILQKKGGNLYESWMMLGTTSAFVLDEINAARNLFLTFLEAFDGRSTAFFFFEHIKLVWDKEESVLDLLYRYGAPMPLLVKFTLSSIQSMLILDKKELLLGFLERNKEETRKLLREQAWDPQLYLLCLKTIYDGGSSFDESPLVDALTSRSKNVVRYAEEKLELMEVTARAAVEKLAAEGNKSGAAAAFRLLSLWEDKKQEGEEENDLQNAVEKRYSKMHEQNVPYKKLVDYSQVRWRDKDEKMPEQILKFYIAEYILLDRLHCIHLCEEIKEQANLYDLRTLVQSLYEMWIADGAKPKFKNLMLPFVLCAASSQLILFKKQIDEWAVNSKPSLAELAVQCMAFNGTRMALLYVEEMSRKHRNKRVKKAALQAMELVMNEFSLTKEEFDDLIVPDFGFNHAHIRFLSYGEREFKIVLGADLSLSIFEGQKQIRSLPRASKKYGDQEELVLAAKEELKAIKKQMKVVWETQKQRMEQAIFSGRKWTVEKWISLFLENPVMYGFATGLIFEEWNEDGSHRGIFRYLDDGSFADLFEEEYKLGENGKIGLVHPSELSAKEVKAWRDQLADYEVIEPVPQMNLPVWNETEIDIRSMIPYQGISIYSASIKSIASKLGCFLCFGDYGSCTGFGFDFEEYKIEMRLMVEPAFDLAEYNVVTKIKSIAFYGEDRREALLLSQVPPRILSFGMMAGDRLKEKEIKREEEN